MLNWSSDEFLPLPPFGSSHSQLAAQSGFSCQPVGTPIWEIGTIVTLGKVFTAAVSIRGRPTHNRSDKNWMSVSWAKVRFHSVAAASRSG